MDPVRAGVRMIAVKRPFEFLLVLLVFTASAFQGLSADTTDLKTVLGRIESFYRKSPGIVADFTQILESRTFPKPQVEAGIVSLKPPGKMRWEYSIPRGKVAVTDGTRAFLYLPEDREVLVGSVEQLDAGAMPTRLLLGQVSLESEFQIEGEMARENPDLWILKLTPLKGDFPYNSLVLEVARESGAIRCIRMLDPLGNRLEYRFERIRVVKDLPEKLFIYRIPRGVEIQTFGEAPAPRPASP
ncbi:MAG: hypothetical protein DMH00_02895 [Acidobacteria bacterium]|nr:MAG: hypothetical protein DMH00_02895 [Acidobacteriota bacterium]